MSPTTSFLSQETQIIEKDEDACEKTTSLVKQAKQAFPPQILQYCYSCCPCYSYPEPCHS